MPRCDARQKKILAAPCPDCGEIIRFVQIKSGNLVPVEPVPYPDKGIVAAKMVEGRLLGYVINQQHPLLDDHDRYVLHHCPTKKRSQEVVDHPHLFP